MNKNYYLCEKRIDTILKRNKSDIKKIKNNFEKTFSKNEKYKLLTVSDKQIPRIIEKIQRSNISLNDFLKKKMDG